MPGLIRATSKGVSVFCILLSTVFLVSCSEESATEQMAEAGVQKKLLEQLIMAQPGDVIEIPRASMKFTRSLSLKVIM